MTEGFLRSTQDSVGDKEQGYGSFWVLLDRPPGDLSRKRLELPGVACPGIKERIARDHTESVCPLWSKGVGEKRIQKKKNKQNRKPRAHQSICERVPSASPRTQHEVTSQVTAGLDPSISLFPTHASPWRGCTNNWQVEENVSTGREGAEGHPSPLLQAPIQRVRKGSLTLSSSVF